MSAQNLYTISYIYYGEKEWSGWKENGVSSGDTWQDAIHNMLAGRYKGKIAYQVMEEKPSEDSRSGILEMQQVATQPKKREMAIKNTNSTDITKKKQDTTQPKKREMVLQNTNSTDIVKMKQDTTLPEWTSLLFLRQAKATIIEGT